MEKHPFKFFLNAVLTVFVGLAIAAHGSSKKNENDTVQFYRSSDLSCALVLYEAKTKGNPYGLEELTFQDAQATFLRAAHFIDLQHPSFHIRRKLNVLERKMLRGYYHDAMALSLSAEALKTFEENVSKDFEESLLVSEIIQNSLTFLKSDRSDTALYFSSELRPRSAWLRFVHPRLYKKVQSKVAFPLGKMRLDWFVERATTKGPARITLFFVF